MRDIEKEVKDLVSEYFGNVEIGALIKLAKCPDDVLYRNIININTCKDDDDDENIAVSLMTMMTILAVKKCKPYFTIKGFTIGAIIGILFMYFVG